MANIWKQSAEWVISLKSDLFFWARLKLTVLYLLIIAILLVFFSAALYNDVSRRFDRDFRRVPPPFMIQNNDETLYDTEMERLLTSLITTDILVFILSAALSYSLAGYTLQPIKDALEAQKAFSADASHELRTPLAVMRNDIEVLLRSQKPLPEEARSVLGSNLEEIKTMSVMTEQLLDLSRGNWISKENFSKINLTELVSGVVAKMKGIADEKGLALGLNASKSEVFVMGDRHNLERMIKNVLHNAISYTKKGSVNVGLSSKGGQAFISIKDTGIGIAKEHLPKIFDRFYKVDASREAGQSGSGLGLAIVQDIAKQHTGAVTIHSEAGRGTEVNIRLPQVAS